MVAKISHGTSLYGALAYNYGKGRQVLPKSFPATA
mgnify:CR=1 FL=1